jgi:hypothetical protein
VVAWVAFGEETFKRALGEVLRHPPIPSFIGELARKVPGTDNLDAYGLNHIYAARITHFDEKGNYLYTEHDVDLSKYWTGTTLTLPPNTKWLAIYSRVPVRYGYIVAYTKYPDWTGWGYDDYSGLWVGFEIGGGLRWGTATWWFRRGGGVNRLYALVGGGGLYAYAGEQTVSLPANYTTARYGYWVKVNRNQVWFGIGNRIRAVVILAKTGIVRRLYDNRMPYTILISDFHVPEVQHALVELDASKAGRLEGVSIELGYGDVRFSEGDPLPPLTLPLYVEASDTILVGQSISTGSITSHPVPTFGYPKKTLYFMADQPGTLVIQAYLLSGNWRTYDSVSVAANTLLRYRVDDEVLLARAVFTPSAYPARILEAEVDMS